MSGRVGRSDESHATTHTGSKQKEHSKRHDSPKGLGGVPDSIQSAGKKHEASDVEGSKKQKKVATSLKVTKAEEKAFLAIYSILANATNRATLTLQVSNLTSISKEVEDVHPFSFLSFVVSSKDLKENLKTVRDNWKKSSVSSDSGLFFQGFKSLVNKVVDSVDALTNPWEKTLSDFSEKMKNFKDDEDHLELLLKEIPKKHHKKINGFIENSQFNELLNYFLDHL